MREEHRHEIRSRGSRGAGSALARRLFAPIDIAGIVYYRIAFGVFALAQLWSYASKGEIAEYWIEPAFHFTFYGFDWVRPWSGDGMYWHFGVLALLAVCIIIGFCYRAAAALFCVGFVYVFLLDKATYLNHLYLFSLISFLIIFIPAHRELSVDAWLRPKLRSENAPTWSLWLIRFQMGVVYFYAGLAKLNADWLHGWPMRLWLPPHESFPIIGRFFGETWFQLFFAYGGLLLDLLVPFFLLWSRTRLLAFAFVVFFHVMNSQMFTIGIFPWFSIASTLPFFAADWPRRILPWPRRSPLPGADAGPLRPSQRLAAAAIALWAAFHVLVPFRHFLYPGHPSWTEEAHNFSWHQKLRLKRTQADFFVTDKATGRVWEVDEDDFLNWRQVYTMSGRPHMLLQFAHHLARHYHEEQGLDVEVRARAMSSLNGREPQLLVDPTVDLAAQPRNLWPKPWILPLSTPRPDEL